MIKYISLLAATVTLSACMDGSGGASVARLDTLSSSCPSSVHMQSGGYPMRCGPQTAAPYTYQ